MSEKKNEDFHTFCVETEEQKEFYFPSARLKFGIIQDSRAFCITGDNRTKGVVAIVDTFYIFSNLN